MATSMVACLSHIPAGNSMANYLPLFFFLQGNKHIGYKQSLLESKRNVWVCERDCSAQIRYQHNTSFFKQTNKKSFWPSGFPIKYYSFLSWWRNVLDKVNSNKWIKKEKKKKTEPAGNPIVKYGRNSITQSCTAEWLFPPFVWSSKLMWLL